MSSAINECIELLGQKAKDKVTGFESTVECICFDLYGCIQVVLKPVVDEKGDTKEAKWFDVTRLNITDTVRVMQPPVFTKKPDGPAEKPVFQRR